MSSRREHYAQSRIRQARKRNTAARARSAKRARTSNPRNHILQRTEMAPFAPPEDWYEETGQEGFSFVVQSPGEGYRHILTPQQIQQRLSVLPKHFVAPLETVSLSEMTRKKQSFPCYGMQWGTTIYLYPLEESLVETFYKPPRPELVTEVKMFGGKWEEPYPGVWNLHWTERTIQDFYLNNILIHELGHMLDERNTSYTDRERYAEWFAIEHGYKATGGQQRLGRKQQVRRRHHAV